MSSELHLVFSTPPESVADEEWNRWYEAHLDEILAVEGWESATRYQTERVVGDGEPDGFRYLVVYTLSLPPSEAVANLAAAGMRDKDSYADAKASDGDGGDPLPLPDWFDQIRFASWNCVQVGETAMSKEVEDSP